MSQRKVRPRMSTLWLTTLRGSLDELGARGVEVVVDLGLADRPPEDLLQKFMDIQALLGHVNLATTQIYTHVSEDRMAGVVAKL